MSEIRRLTQSDIDGLMRLSRAAGWNQIEADWLRLLDVEPEGCFGLVSEGVLAATTTAVCFGRKLAWIGMVLTDPDFRRRGLARRLMEHALEFLDQRRVEWVKLDATDMGRPLYLALGFEDESRIERWKATSPPHSGAGASASERFDLDAALDRAGFGADRAALLQNLARDHAVSIPGEGYAMSRAGGNASTFGPCVARSPEAARTLLELFLARHPGETVFWDLLPHNREAVNLARDFGFAPIRKLARMVRPGAAPASPPARDDSLIYATAGFEYG